MYTITIGNTSWHKPQDGLSSISFEAVLRNPNATNLKREMPFFGYPYLTLQYFC